MMYKICESCFLDVVGTKPVYSTAMHGLCESCIKPKYLYYCRVAGVNQMSNELKEEKKYYATRSGIDYPALLKSEEEAILDAHKKMAENPKLNEYYVVKVVKIVRKPLPLLEVIDA